MNYYKIIKSTDSAIYFCGDLDLNINRRQIISLKIVYLEGINFHSDFKVGKYIICSTKSLKPLTKEEENDLLKKIVFD